MQKDIESLFNGKRTAKVEVEQLIQLVGGHRATKRNRQKVEKMLWQEQIRLEPRVLPNSIHKKVTLYRGKPEAAEAADAVQTQAFSAQGAEARKSGVVITLNLDSHQYEALKRLVQSARALESLFPESE